MKVVIFFVIFVLFNNLAFSVEEVKSNNIYKQIHKKQNSQNIKKDNFMHAHSGTSNVLAKGAVQENCNVVLSQYKKNKVSQEEIENTLWRNCANILKQKGKKY